MPRPDRRRRRHTVTEARLLRVFTRRGRKPFIVCASTEQPIRRYRRGGNA